MIIRNSSMLSKKQKGIIMSISLFIDIIIIAIIIASAIISFKTNINLVNEKYQFIVILAICGTISFGDIISIFTKRKSIAFCVFQILFSRKDIFSQMGIEINSKQLSFCEKIVGTCSDKKLIYVFGKENRGKSTAVLYLLKSLLMNSNSINELPWLNNITFIDCTNNKEEILDYFFKNDSVLNRIKRFDNCLIVIDNIECLGNLFLEENISLFSSCRSFFILIEDTSFSVPMCGKDALKDAMYICNFNSSVISVNSRLDLYKTLVNFDSTTKNVFFALYFSTLTSSFAKKKNIYKVLNIKKKEFNRSFKKIQKLKLFITFPYNAAFCYCCRKSDLKYVDEQFGNDLTYNSTLKLFAFSDLIDSESKWRCLIRSTLPTIELMSQLSRYDLFHKALQNGNYKSLYDELDIVTKSNVEKEKIFLYEKAHLAFHIGNHKESTDCYLKLINSQNTLERKKVLMIGIIESSHGNPDQTNIQMIENMIKKLMASHDFYSLCAKYWQIHILSEKGVFAYDDMSKIREEISKYPISLNNEIQQSIIHRSFTDEIRFHHILGHAHNDSLYNCFIEYLGSCGKAKQEYFHNLYIEANHIHYIELLNSVLEQKISEQELIDLVRSAEYYYDKALSSLYSDEKSKRATKVKKTDLKMMYWDFNFNETIQQINVFLLHSRINKVGVHEAYCETLLMKAHILDPDNISNELGLCVSEEKKNAIYTHFNNATKIFKNYRNNYGIFRLKFIILLFELLLCDEITTLRALKNLTKCNPCYEKENKIVDILIQKQEKGNLSKIYLLSIIRAYPIILQ